MVSAKRQNIRIILMIIWVILMPITLFYYSPYLPFLGLAEGIIAGSIFVFITQFLLSIVFGRVFCGWICPAGAVQEFTSLVNPSKVNRSKMQWIKYVLWLPWLAAWVSIALSALRIREIPLKPELFYNLEDGISVSRPEAYIIYLLVLTLILTISIILGRRSFCHTTCWMAPFMVLGQKLGRILRFPGIHIRSNQMNCISCDLCSKVCPMSINIGKLANSLNSQKDKNIKVKIIHHDCIFCMRCADVCPGKVLSVGFGCKN